MATIVKEIKLIMSDVGNNNNKHWRGELYDNGDVRTVWGRVGVTEDSKLFPSVGEAFLLKKEKEKLKKGYVPLKVVGGATSTTQSVSSSDLSQIAKSQIRTTKPELQKLIDRLVLANVHKITSSTQITYNNATGLFSTPMGIITLEAVTEARDLLGKITPYILSKDYKNNKLMGLVGNYLMLCPQNLGMKINLESFLPDQLALQKQLDLIDALEASFNAVTKAPQTQGDKKTVQEKVFDVELDLLEDQKEVDRINKFYRSTANGIHASYRLKIVKIYKLRLLEMEEAFKEGSKVGNIKELWHGTKKANLLSILKSGLKVSPPSTAAIAGKMFGNGVYFSDQSTKSLNYAYGYWDGKYEKDCFMLLNKVAMGKEYIPSGPSQNLPKPGYDSTFAVGGKSGVGNNELIVYQNDRINITHLVEFSE